MTVVVRMRFMFDVSLCDFLVCLDVYGVCVVVECCLFPKSVCCLFYKWMKWVCGMLRLLSDL